MTIHLCRFDSTEDIPKKKRTYEVIKARVLERGRFSVFEATADAKNAALFTRLCRDPELIIDHESLGYPWTVVKKRESEAKPK